MKCQMRISKLPPRPLVSRSPFNIETQWLALWIKILERRWGLSTWTVLTGNRARPCMLIDQIIPKLEKTWVYFRTASDPPIIEASRRDRNNFLAWWVLIRKRPLTNLELTPPTSMSRNRAVAVAKDVVNLSVLKAWTSRRQARLSYRRERQRFIT